MLWQELEAGPMLKWTEAQPSVTGKYPDLLIFRGLKWYGGTKHHYQAVAALGFNYHH